MIKCPKCGVDNEDNHNFCESCGEKLKFNHKICPGCGKEIVGGAKFCEECGVSLETAASAPGGSKIQEDRITDKPDNTVTLDLTPAESLVILNHKSYHGYGTTPKELLKMTFIDLIFKGVFKLDVQEVEKKGLLGRKMVKKIYLYEGKNFNMPLKPHEEIFRKYLPGKVNSKRFKELQKRVARSARSNYTKKKLLEPLAEEGFFHVEKKFLGKRYSLSPKGMETQQIIRQLKDEGKDLENWIETDPEKAKAYLLMGGSNIFLTDDYYFDWFKNNSKKIGKLFAGVAVLGTAYAFSNIRWYRAFGRIGRGIDFDDFDNFDSFDDSFTDIFSDFDAFDAFDSMDFSDFDSGFDDGGFDGGGDFGGGE